ncbi:MAG: tagaturonate reductase, partial [Hominilimicola sp.]
MERLKRTEKCSLTERVLQFGEGNFLRGFVDWMIDRLNKENGGDYGVVIVQPLANGLVDMINEQDGLYSLYLRG